MCQLFELPHNATNEICSYGTAITGKIQSFFPEFAILGHKSRLLLIRVLIDDWEFSVARGLFFQGVLC